MSVEEIMEQVKTIFHDLRLHEFEQITQKEVPEASGEHFDIDYDKIAVLNGKRNGAALNLDYVQKELGIVDKSKCPLLIRQYNQHVIAKYRQELAEAAQNIEGTLRYQKSLPASKHLILDYFQPLKYAGTQENQNV